MRSTDKYRRDSLDGGTTWGASYQFKGTDGQNGSNAYLPTYITETVISKGRIAAPIIDADVLSIYPSSSTDVTSEFNIYGMNGGKQKHGFQIKYTGVNDVAGVAIGSPSEAWIQFYGDISFTNANVWGLTIPAVFG